MALRPQPDVAERLAEDVGAVRCVVHVQAEQPVGAVRRRQPAHVLAVGRPQCRPVRDQLAREIEVVRERHGRREVTRPVMRDVRRAGDNGELAQPSCSACMVHVVQQPRVETGQ